jgi:hypothetical protein
MVMVANQSKAEFWWMTGAYPGRIGHLYSIGDKRGPWDFMPYALDNGAFPLWEKNLDWTEAPWLRLLENYAGKIHRPRWALVPDVVADRDRTLERWHQYVDVVRGFGLRPAFALQDGMTFEDVPSDDCMLFVGGSTAWKLAAITPWCARFPGRVHVGRVNTPDRLELCHRAGAVSVDGTGWWHKRQCKQLVKFIKETSA